MDDAYFVGRTTLQLGLSKVERSSARPSPSSRSVLIALVVQQRFEFCPSFESLKPIRRFHGLQAAAGAVACKLMDAAHPGAVPMHMIRNYKVLQDVFNKLKITKVRHGLVSLPCLVLPAWGFFS